MKIYLDFDGTVVEHEYPKIGRPNFECFPVISALQAAGHYIILNTMRSDFNDGSLEKAMDFLNYRDDIDPIANNTASKIHPPPWEPTNQYSIFIDDQAANIPLRRAEMTNGWMVDWNKVSEDLIRHNVINADDLVIP